MDNTRYTSAHALRLYGWRRRACAPASVLARLCLCTAGGVGATAASVGRCHRHRLRLLCLSRWRLHDAYMNGWRRALLYGELVRRPRHCEYFNKVGPYCWRSNVLIIHDGYCLDGYLLGCGTNYNLSNIKAPCGIYFRNRLPYIAWDIVKILTRDAPIDGGASPL